MNIKTCKICDRELPESAFMRTKGGGLTGTCRECRTAALRENKAAKRSQGGGKTPPFSDPDFDGRTIGDVWRQMCRAEKWLESRGCVITLDGEFHELKITKLKKE